MPGCSMRLPQQSNAGTDDFIRLLAHKFDLGAEAGASKPLLSSVWKCSSANGTRPDRRRRSWSTRPKGSVSRCSRRYVSWRISRRLGKAPAAGPGRAARTGRATRRAEPSPVEAAGHASRQLEPFDVRTRPPISRAGFPSAGGMPSRMFTLDAVKLIHEYSAESLERSTSFVTMRW